MSFTLNEQRVICGVVCDSARAKFGDGCMGASERSEVETFYKRFIAQNPEPIEGRAH